MVRLPLRAVVSVALAACSTGADPALRDPWTWRDLPEPTPVSLSSAGTLKVTPLGTFGSDTGSGMLGLISAVAATDKELFVFDRSTCEVVVFARSTRSATRRFGRCGRGPTDMEFATSMAVSNDTLVLTDRAGEWMALWSTSGQPLATNQFSLADSAWLNAFYVSSIDSGRYGISVDLLSNRGTPNGRQFRGQGAAHFRIVDRSGRQIQPGLFVDGQGPERQTEALHRGLATCASVDRKEKPYVTSINGWVSQLAIVSLENEERPVRFNHVYRDSPIRPKPKANSNGTFVKGGMSAIVCDRDRVIASMLIDSSSTIGERQVTWLMVELEDFETFTAKGTVRDTEWFGAPSAIRGNSAFVVQNHVADYPRVFEVRIETGAHNEMRVRP